MDFYDSYTLQELWSKIKSEDLGTSSAAFGMLDRKFRLVCLAVLVHKWGPAAEDSFQEAMAKLWVRRMEIDPRKNPIGWLFLTTKNLLINESKKAGRNALYEAEIEAMFMTQVEGVD